MDYLEISLKCKEGIKDILIAEMDALGYDSFLDNEEGFMTYIEKETFDQGSLDHLLERYQSEIKEVLTREVEKTNWNEEWEKNYEPIIVEGQCIVRASFHQPDRSYLYDIIINPKMSFGTGHHETTYMMLQYLLKSDLAEKKVMDAGCGTAVLAILAKMRGAKEVHGFDIDDWAVENSKENIAMNGCEDILISQSTIKEYEAGDFDVFLANINKNVLLEEAKDYSLSMKNGGLLFLSGFYESDIPDLKKAFETQGFLLKESHTRNKWASMMLLKE